MMAALPTILFRVKIGGFHILFHKIRETCQVLKFLVIKFWLDWGMICF